MVGHASIVASNRPYPVNLAPIHLYTDCPSMFDNPALSVRLWFRLFLGWLAASCRCLSLVMFYRTGRMRRPGLGLLPFTTLPSLCE